MVNFIIFGIFFYFRPSPTNRHWYFFLPGDWKQRRRSTPICVRLLFSWNLLCNFYRTPVHRTRNNRSVERREGEAERDDDSERKMFSFGIYTHCDDDMVRQLKPLKRSACTVQKHTFASTQEKWERRKTDRSNPLRCELSQWDYCRLSLKFAPTLSTHNTNTDMCAWNVYSCARSRRSSIIMVYCWKCVGMAQ